MDNFVRPGSIGATFSGNGVPSAGYAHAVARQSRGFRAYVAAEPSRNSIATDHHLRRLPGTLQEQSNPGPQIVDLHMTGLHVAILTPGFAVDEGDTNCVPALQDFLLALGRQHPSVSPTVFTLRYPSTREIYAWHGIAVHPANGRQLGFPLKLVSWARLMRAFASVMRRKPIQLVHSFWLGECAFLGEPLSRLYGVPHVVTLMGQEVAVSNPYAVLLKSKRTTFVAVSEFQRRELMKRTGRDAHHVIPWGFAPLPPRAPEQRDIDVLGVGALTRVKDFDTFLDVVARLAKVRPTLSCRIAGDGPLRLALEARARELGLHDQVTFEGRIPREGVLNLMRRSKVLLHTSNFESFGLVFAEARACGARIVSRSVGIAEPSTNWLQCRDPHEMAAAVGEFITAREFPEEPTHPIANTVNAYYELYRVTCGSGRGFRPAVHSSAQ
jgi:1,2-diacylglycerol 3-alpha-glucosyltransferase